MSLSFTVVLMLVIPIIIGAGGMRIIVLASAARQGGALSIYRQFLKHLPEFIGNNNRFYVFVDDVADRSPIDGIVFIMESDYIFRRI